MRITLALAALLLAVPLNAGPKSDDVSLFARGWSWEDIGHAKAIAKKAGVKYERVVELRDAGLAWSQISEGHGFKLAEVAGQAQEQAQKSKEKSAAKAKRSAPSLAVQNGVFEAPSSTGSR